jgi:hypothetical protein
MTIEQRVRELKTRGLSIPEIAAIFNISVETVSDFFDGDRVTLPDPPSAGLPSAVGASAGDALVLGDDGDESSAEWSPVAAQSGSPRIVGALATNLGATQTVTFTGAEEVWLLGTLNANLAVTVVGRTAGARLKLIAVQDATGSRTLTIEGTTVTIPTSAAAGVVVDVYCPNATDIDIVVPGGGTGDTHPFPISYTTGLQAALDAKQATGTAVLKTLADAKGDLFVASAADTVARQAAGTDGYALVADSSQTNGVKYSHRPQVLTATKTGALTAAAGTVRLPIMEGGTIEDVRIMAGTAPTGASLIVDVNKNGTTIFTTQGNRPTVAISGNASSAAVPDVTSLAAGDYLTVDIDQIGSTIAGSDLCVAVRYRLAA